MLYEAYHVIDTKENKDSEVILLEAKITFKMADIMSFGADFFLEHVYKLGNYTPENCKKALGICTRIAFYNLSQVTITTPHATFKEAYKKWYESQQNK